MDLFKAAETYVVEMTTRKGGMKALLLDEHTTAPVSMVYSHSDILQNEIYLVGSVLDRKGDPAEETFPDVEAIVFVRPCRARCAHGAHSAHTSAIRQSSFFMARRIAPALRSRPTTVSKGHSSAQHVISSLYPAMLSRRQRRLIRCGVVPGTSVETPLSFAGCPRNLLIFFR